MYGMTRKNPKGARRNPMSGAQKFLLGTLALGGLAGGGYAYMKSREAAAKKKAPAGLTGVYEADARLMNAPSVVGDLQVPFYLRTAEAGQVPAGDPTAGDMVPSLRVFMPAPENKIVAEPYVAVVPQGVILGATPSDWSVAATLSRLVTDLTPAATKKAYELLLAEIRGFMQGGGDWLTDHDAAIVRVLQKVAPNTGWQNGLQPYTPSQPQSRVWYGVQLLGTLANQSEHNKQVLRGG